MAWKNWHWAVPIPVLVLAAIALLMGAADGPREGSQPEAGVEALGQRARPESSAAPRDRRPPSEPGPGRVVLELDSAARTRDAARIEPPREEAARRAASSEARALPKGRGRITLSVQDGSGRSLRDVSVTLQALDDPQAAGQAVTGGDGEARFIGLAPGKYAYRAQIGDRPEIAAGEVQLERGEWKELAIRLVGASLAIHGRVLNRRGEAVGGIRITAARHRFASAVNEAARSDGSVLRTRSRADGSFEISGLSEGEYEVETAATARYFSLKAQLRAGGPPVDLVLAGGHTVQGTVRDSYGEPLALVWVGLQSLRNVYTHSEEDGSYQLQLGSNPGDSLLRFYLQGYEEELVQLWPADLEPDFEPDYGSDVDATLRELEDAAIVSGLVRTERGDPIAGATLSLSTPTGAVYQAVSGPEGDFSVRVKIGARYYLRVVAPAQFLDYAKRDIRVTEDGVSFDLVLEPLRTGRLSGRIIDSERQPIPGLRIWLVRAGATRSAVPITSDANGYFELAEAPAGDLSFDTRSSPRFTVSGLFLAPDGEADVVLVLDSGDHELEGSVLGDRGDPVAGAEVTLSWSYDNGRKRSSSRRSTRTDGEGVFRFTRLGPGKHMVEVRAAGYARQAEAHDIGHYAPRVEVRLESNSD